MKLVSFKNAKVQKVKKSVFKSKSLYRTRRIKSDLEILSTVEVCMKRGENHDKYETRNTTYFKQKQYQKILQERIRLHHNRKRDSFFYQKKSEKITICTQNGQKE